MKDRESDTPRRVYYPVSTTTTEGFSRQPAPDAFGRRDATPLEIQDILEQAATNRPPKVKPPKGQR